MPPEGMSLEPHGNLYLIGEDGQVHRIGTLGSLSLDEREDGTWSGDAGVIEWDAEFEIDVTRLLYIIGARRQRKTVLEKRKRRKRHDN